MSIDTIQINDEDVKDFSLFITKKLLFMQDFEKGITYEDFFHFYYVK